MSAEHEFLVIGGGPAGSALGIALARAGRDVLLIEKERDATDKVCGEFLSAEAMHSLNSLGIDLYEMGAVPISLVRLAGGRFLSEARLPFQACSLSRRVLDESLLQRASDLGVVIRRGSRVNALTAVNGDTWEAQTEKGAGYCGTTAFLCTGKHDVRGWARVPGKQNDLIAFKMHWRLSGQAQRQLTGAVELILFPGGYCGLQPIEGGLANLALLVDRSVFLRLRSWSSLLRHMCNNSRHLQQRLAGAEPVWKAPLAVYGIPYGYVRTHDDGVWRLGDQAAVVPSFTGSGLSIAFHSARVAAAAVLSGRSDAIYRSLLQRELSQRIRLATWISRGLTNAKLSGCIAALAASVPSTLTALGTFTRLSDEPALS